MVRTVLVILLGVASGCSQFFSLDKTQLEPEAMPDASTPPMCPAVDGVPAFAPSLYQVDARTCAWYGLSQSGEFAASLCRNDVTSFIAGGDPSAPMTQMKMSDGRTAQAVRLAPDGSTALISYYDITGYIVTAEYTRNGTMWDPSGKPFQPLGSGYQYPSTPTAGPSPHIVIERFDDTRNANIMSELARGGDGSWNEISGTLLTELGVDSLVEPQLSPDGLRLVFVGPDFNVSTGGTGTGTGPGWGTGSSPLYYTDRRSLDDPFGKARVIATVPEQVHYPFMTPDCGRIYFYALNTVWYLSEY